MTFPPDLEEEISILLAVNYCHMKEKRNEYLSTLRGVLDLYLFETMEEEDQLYSLLHQNSWKVPGSFNDMKILSPFRIQINILMSLPFLPTDIKFEYADRGFLKLKLPENLEEKMASSRIYRDACNRGLQKSLIRYLMSWKDGDNYLKQSAVLQWFRSIVNKGLELTGDIPDYQITQKPHDQKVVLELIDVKNDKRFYVTLLPVFVFPVSQLPNRFSGILPEDPTCSEWMLECFSKASNVNTLWGISLWQHEKMIIRQNLLLKPMIRILKCLRDANKLHLLYNRHIKNIVMLEFKREPGKFAGPFHAELLSQLLLALRDGLVCREGLPSVWDMGHNLLGGMTGQQKSELARSITAARESLQKSPISPFILETYDDISKSTPQTSNSTPETSKSTPETSKSTPQTSKSTPQTNSQQEAAQEAPRPSASSKSEYRLPPRADFRAENGSRNGSGLAQRSSVNWKQVGAVAGTIGAAVVGIAALFAVSSKKNKN